MSKTYFVSRHAGAQEWAKRHGYADVEVVEHFDTSTVKDGDTVIGVLPVMLAAEVCQNGGAFIALNIRIPAEMRGKEISADDMDRFGASLQQYQVTAVD